MLILDKIKVSEIIEDLKYILEYDLNFMDLEGVIIASTSSSRIGTTHLIAQKCIETKQIISITKQDQNRECKNGINAPLVIDNKVVGVIGITGPVDEVEKYIHVIVKMTQRQIINQLDTELHNMRIRQHENFVNQIINNQQNEALNLNNSKYQIAIFKVDNSINVMSDIIKKKFKCFVKKDQELLIVIAENNDILLIVEQLLTNYELLISKVINSASNIQKLLIQMFKIMNCGVSKNKINYFNDYLFELLITNDFSIDQDSIFDSFYSNFTQAKLLEMKPVIVDYYENNRALQLVAKKHSMHANSVKYKLTTIRDESGLDYTDFKDSLVIYYAFKNLPCLLR